MKICITGGTGFLGSWVLKLSPNNNEFVVLSRKNCESINVKNRVIKTDYSYENLKNIFKNNDFDAIIHLAARKVESRYGLYDYLKINSILTDNLLNICKEFSIDNIVLASSRLVYSHKNKLPWNEDCNAFPLHYYGMSKLLSDNLTIYYSQKYNMNCKSLRFAQIFGYDFERNQIENQLFDCFINRALNNKYLKIYGDGKTKREYIYVKDAVKSIFSALDNPKESGIFNIGLGKNITIPKLAEYVNTVFDNEKSSYKLMDNRVKDNFDNLLDVEKSKIRLGFTPDYGIKEGLMDIKEIMNL